MLDVVRGTVLHIVLTIVTCSICTRTLRTKLLHVTLHIVSHVVLDVLHVVPCCM